MCFTVHSKVFPQYACPFQSIALLTCGKTYEITFLKTELFDDCFFTLLQELRNSSNQFAVFIQLEPVSLLAALYFNIGTDLINYLTGCRELIHHNGFHTLTFKRPKSTISKNFRCILQYKINSQIRLIRTILLECITIRNSGKRCLRCLFINTVLCKYGR